MMRLTVIFRLIIVAITAFLTASCNHRDILSELPSKRVPVEIEFDWSNDPGASPEGMTVYFFNADSDNSRPTAFDFKGNTGGSITLMPGTYSAICHNNDSHSHGVVGTNSYDEFGIRLNDHRNSGNPSGVLPRTDNINNERVAYVPDSIWVADISYIVIPESEIADTKSRKPVIIRFEMKPVVHHYMFRITNPINFNKSLSVSASLSGMASTVHPGRGSTGDETVTHLFEMISTPDGNLWGEILTFGHCSGKPLHSKADENESEKESPHILSIQATLANGERWTSVHDVTRQIHESPVLDCTIRLDSISFPTNSDEGGFSPSVGGWSGNQEIIGM